MAKKKSATRRTGGKVSKAKSSRKSYRSAVVGTIDTLPIVESESGCAPAWK